MHEHVGEQLVYVELGGLDEVESEQLVQVNVPTFTHNEGEKHENVDDD